MDAMIKFSELDRELAAHTYDGMIGTFTTNDVVDEETQKNDLDMDREVLKVTMEVPHRARLRFQLREKKQTPKATAPRALPSPLHLDPQLGYFISSVWRRFFGNPS